MKKLLFAFCFLPFLLSAQDEPVSDTSWIEKHGNLFFEVKKEVYPNGSEAQWKSPIGDSAALILATKNRITSKAATLAVDARYISTAKKQLTTLQRESDGVAALTGTDPLKLVQSDHAAALLSDGWTVKRDGTTSPVVFTVNAQGNLRYAVNGGATKAVTVYGDVIRLKNYPSNGTDTDVFLLRNGNFTNLDRSTILRPPGNDAPVNRATAAPAKTKKG